MFELKAIDPAAVPKALEKAERYRLLAEPEEAESICLDVLAVDPDNEEALVMLLLALTDQLRTAAEVSAFARAQALLPQLSSEYLQRYYAGLICERRGSAHLDRGGNGAGSIACAWLHQAMEWYEKAEAVRPPNNDDAILRWNTCARIIMKHDLKPPVDAYEPILME
jgi:hypothetical protein